MAPWSGLTIKAASSVMLAALGCLTALASDHRDPRTGIPIRTEVDASTFPESWQTSEICACGEALHASEVPRSLRIARESLALYPADLLRKELRAVQFADHLTFFGLTYGGTNSLDTVYIANGGVSLGFSDDYLAKTFHHEFSSILLRNHARLFDERAWRAATGRAYGDGGIAALKNGTSETRYDERYNADGLLNQYAAASIEEDFNTFAEALLTGDRRFWSLADKHPRIAAKRDLAIDFYAGLDPQFSLRFFKSLVK